MACQNTASIAKCAYVACALPTCRSHMHTLPHILVTRSRPNWELGGQHRTEFTPAWWGGRVNNNDNKRPLTPKSMPVGVSSLCLGGFDGADKLGLGQRPSIVHRYTGTDTAAINRTAVPVQRPSTVHRCILELLLRVECFRLGLGSRLTSPPEGGGL